MTLSFFWRDFFAPHYIHCHALKLRGKFELYYNGNVLFFGLVKLSDFGQCLQGSVLLV